MSDAHVPRVSRDVLAWLARDGRLGAENYVGALATLHEYVTSRFSAFDEDELLDTPDDFTSLQWNKFLVMKGNARGPVLPVAAIRFRFDTHPFVMRFKVFYFTKSGDDMRAIGMRFETPEKFDFNGEDGDHDYYHAQLFHSYRQYNHDHSLPGCPAWIPTGYPAPPLPATNVAELLACAIVATYGAPKLGEVLASLRSRDLFRGLTETTRSIIPQ